MAEVFLAHGKMEENGERALYLLSIILERSQTFVNSQHGCGKRLHTDCNDQEKDCSIRDSYGERMNDRGIEID